MAPGDFMTYEVLDRKVAKMPFHSSSIRILGCLRYNA